MHRRGCLEGGLERDQSIFGVGLAAGHCPPEISLVRNSAEVASILSPEKSGIEGGRLARRSFSSREAAARGARLVAKRLSRDVSTAYC